MVSIEREGFQGRGRADWLAGLSEERLTGLHKEVKAAKDGVLAAGRHRVVVLDFERHGEKQAVAVKSFGRQTRWKDHVDGKRGTKAARSFRAACFLEDHGVDTPPPLAYLERWEGSRLVESYYVSAYMGELKSLKHELLRIYEANGPCSDLVDLLELIGGAMRRMHDAGFYHRDLGNQNIELLSGSEAGRERVFFLDLNRSRIREKLSIRERAQDFARLSLPSAFLNILIKIYWNSKVPQGFREEVTKHRRRFSLWSKSRQWRHPMKSFRKARKRSGPGTQPLKDIWIWDDRSGQAAITLDKRDRKKCHSWANHLKIVFSNSKAVRAIYAGYRHQKSEAFQSRIGMAGRIGMSLEPADLEMDAQVKYLSELGRLPVLLRFGHHEGKQQWEKTLAHLEHLHRNGHPVMVAVLQDRRAVLNPDSWENFLQYLFENLDGKVETIEIGHVVNRVKWGIHNLKEYRSLLSPVIALQAKYPGIKVVGPACIDFEFYYTVAMLDYLPDHLRFDALSHCLYVDRSGAPENYQGRFGIIEKAALLKAIAVQSGNCGDRVIVSEANWPLVDTGVWSPVAASYMPPGAKGSKVHVTEQQYGWYMIRYLALTLCSGMVDRIYWWRLVAHGFGLIDERAVGGWRKRVGFQMLKTFLHELGEATFVEKMSMPSEVYALRFERVHDEVILLWCNGDIFTGPWPDDYEKVIDSQGRATELSEIGDEPVYLISRTIHES